MIDIKIVIIEDDEFLLKKITKILQREVATVYSFSNPLEAIEHIKKIVPDLIISDINMPEMSGLEMYKELRDLSLDIPIILASAFSEPEYFIEAIKLKVKNFIVKPIDLEDLIDELKQFEQELLSNKEQVKQERMLLIQSKMAAMGEMLTNIAHQWKQPLNTISVCSSNIRLEKELGNIIDKNDIVEEMLGNINDSITYMSDTINDFQTYLKPNKVQSCFFLSDTIDKIEKLTSSQVKFNHITLLKEVDDLYICSFQNELVQVLINVFKNAIDELVKIDGEKILKVQAIKDNEKYIITVHDNAGGIDENIIENIFEPFFTTKKDSGSGIGLHMSKQILESHLNGKISVSNEKFDLDGKSYMGAKFVVELQTLEDIILDE